MSLLNTVLLCALGAVVLTNPVHGQPLRVPLLWPEGVHLGLQTYDGHSEIGMKGAVDFFLTHNRPDAFNRDRLGRRENTPLLAPFDGDLYAFIDEREPGYVGEFAPIDPQRVAAGLDSLPVGSFSFPDGATGRRRQFTQTIVVHDGEIGFRMIHSTWNVALLSAADQRRLREAIGTLAAAPSPAPAVLRKLERRVSRGDTVGFLYGWDAANTHPHVHLNIFRNPDYSESNPGWGTFLDLTDPGQVLMGGQVILDRRFEISRRETWLTGLVYQYPAMPRSEFKPGLPVVVDTDWAGQGTTVPRTSPDGAELEPLCAGTRLTVASGTPEVGDWSVWIPVADAGGASLWVRAEHLRIGAPPRSPDAVNTGSAEDARRSVAVASPTPLAERPASGEPRARLEPAPLLEFPADPDCNSPGFWHEGRLYLFTSNQRPSRSVGPDLERLGAPEPSTFDDGVRKLRWIEAVHLRDDGVLFGLYHREEYLGECPDREYFTVPDIGVARSRDLGRTWTDLGLVLQDHGVTRSCDTPNKFFAGGVGDPSWAIDPAGGYAYIFFSSYTDPVSNQGVQVARLALGDLEAPVGKVWRWTGKGWDAPGLGGKGKPAVPARVAWSDPRADAFWGPSVHWNTYLGQHVVLVNRASDAAWTQEGVYVFFAPDLARPETFTPPRKLHDGGSWYCQVIGDAGLRGTDSLAGQSARFFMKGKSRHRVVFERLCRNQAQP